jgi:hypothetical protein
MKKLTSSLRALPVILAGALLCAAATGCSSNADDSKRAPNDVPVPMAALQSTPEGEAQLKIATWELYKTKIHGFNVLARDRQGKVLHAINFRLLSQSQSQSTHPRVHLNFGYGATMLIDQEAGVIQSSIGREHLVVAKSLGDALKARRGADVQYGCWGDIFWAIGGLITTVPVCAATIPGLATGPIDGFIVASCVGTVLGGPVAGIVSAMEDCDSGLHASVSVDIQYDYFWDPFDNCWVNMADNSCMPGGGSDENLPP